MLRTIRTLATLAGIVAALATATPAAAQVTITDLGTLPGGDHSYAYDTNNQGQVVGKSETATGEEHAFLWQNGVMTDLGTFDGMFSDYFSSEATAINDHGQVVGVSQFDDSYGGFRAALWENGTITALGPLPGNHYTTAYDINTDGQVVGISYSAHLPGHAVLWENGTIIALGHICPPSYMVNSTAYAINDLGQVVGESCGHAFLWQNGVMTDLGTLGSEDSFAYDINDQGQVVGKSWTAARKFRAFVWQNGTMTALRAMGQTSGSEARAISNQGQIVGTVDFPGGTRAVLVQNRTVTALHPLGGERSFAEAINELGQIVGYSKTATGETHATLWTVTP